MTGFLIGLVITVVVRLAHHQEVSGPHSAADRRFAATQPHAAGSARNIHSVQKCQEHRAVSV